MRGREDERAQPWLLIKENDDEARPAAQYDVTEALPDSVIAGKKKSAKKRGAPAPDRPPPPG